MRLRHFLIWLLILVLTICPLSTTASSAVLTTMQRENAYNAAVSEFENYLLARREDPAALTGIITELEQARIGQSESLRDYAAILRMIAEGSFGYDLWLNLSVLKLDQAFNAFLAEELKGSPIRPLNELEAYAEGRQAESKGNVSEAQQAYGRCLSFFDAKERYKQLRTEASESIYQHALKMLQTGDLAGAYYLFQQAEGYSDSDKKMQGIVALLGYTPKDAQDNLLPVANLRCQNTDSTSAALIWDASEHATEYEVSYRVGNSGNWIVWGTKKDISVSITNLVQGKVYDFRVVACIGKTVRSEERVLTGIQLIQLLTPITPGKGSNPNLLDNSEAERKTSGGFIGIEVYQALQAYIGQTVTISFDLKASESLRLMIYPYQRSGVSIDGTYYVQPAKEYQRYSFTTTVKDYGYDDLKLTKGTMGIYDSSKTSGLTFSVRRIKIELGTQATAWSPSAKDSATPVPSPTPTPAPTPTLCPTETQRPTPSPTITLSGISQNEVNSLSWNVVPGVSQYVLQRRLGTQEYTQIYSGSDTSYIDNRVIGGYRYTYKVMARLSSGQTIASNELSVLTSTTVWPTPTAVFYILEPDPTRFMTTGPVSSFLEYRYRDSFETFSEWSDWSDWGTRQNISDSDLMQEEIKYIYGWQAIKCRVCGHNSSCADSVCYSCGAAFGDSFDIIFEQTDHDQGQIINGYGGGYGIFVNGEPYWGPAYIQTYYRYRTRTIVTEMTEWSEWSTTIPEDQPGREIEIRKLVRRIGTGTEDN